MTPPWPKIDHLFARVDPSLAYPLFLARLSELLSAAAAAGRQYWVVEMHRGYARSDELFAQGRTKPGPIVTNARAGQSAHNFSIAADLVLDGYIDRAGLQPDYRPESYDLLGHLAPKHGLVWGGSWKFRDLPHVQLPDFITATDMAPLRDAFQAGGMDGVFRVLDAHFAQGVTP